VLYERVIKRKFSPTNSWSTPKRWVSRCLQTVPVHVRTINFSVLTITGNLNPSTCCVSYQLHYTPCYSTHTTILQPFLAYTQGKPAVPHTSKESVAVSGVANCYYKQQPRTIYLFLFIVSLLAIWLPCFNKLKLSW